MELRALLKALGQEAAPIAAPGSTEIDLVIQTPGPGGPQHSAAVAVVSTPAPRDYHKIMSEEAFDTWLEKLKAAPLISFDTETDSLDYMKARIVGMAFAVAPREAAYVPLEHDYP